MLPFRGDTSGVIFEPILNRPPASAVRLNPDIPPKLERDHQQVLWRKTATFVISMPPTFGLISNG